MAGGIQFDVVTNCADLADLISDIANKKMPQESAKALNRTVTYVRQEVAAEVHQRTGLSKTLLRKRVKQIKNRRGSSKNLRTVGFVGEFTVPVSKVTPKPRRAGRGVTYKTVPGSPHDDAAFFAQMGSGKKSAFVRKGRARLPITEKQINIAPYLRRSVRRVLRGPGRAFYDKVLVDNMEARLQKEIAKKGLTPK